MLFASFSFKSSWEKSSVLQGGGTCLGLKKCLFRSMDLQSQPAADLHLQLPSYTGRFTRERWGRQSQAGGCIKNLALCYFSKVRSTSMDWFPLEGEKTILQKESFSNAGAGDSWNFLCSSILEQAPSGGAAGFLLDVWTRSTDIRVSSELSLPAVPWVLLAQKSVYSSLPDIPAPLSSSPEVFLPLALPCSMESPGLLGALWHFFSS